MVNVFQAINFLLSLSIVAFDDTNATKFTTTTKTTLDHASFPTTYHQILTARYSDEEFFYIYSTEVRLFCIIYSYVQGKWSNKITKILFFISLVVTHCWEKASSLFSIGLGFGVHKYLHFY